MSGISSKVSGKLENKFKYNGKEEQRQEFSDGSGLEWLDYGWRMYIYQTGRWGVIDAKAQKYERFTPYCYAVNNPLIYIDPDGMGVNDVIIRGDKAKEAFEQLQQSTSLKLKMDDNGKVTATGKVQTDADKALQTAVNDKENIVVVDATSSNYTKDGNWFVGGAFGGSDLMFGGKNDGKAVATQTVNPDQTKKIDEFYGAPKGTSIMHEILEGYIGAKDSPGSGAPTFDNTTPEFKNYKSAHDKTQTTDPRHPEPVISQDCDACPKYINKPHAIFPNLNIELMINDMKKRKK